nr:hypothetical protein [Tanacetum cinerariifolium]
MDNEEVSDRYVAPCFVNGLEVYDDDINLGMEENMISNEFAVKLCLEHKVRRGNKVVKKELINALRGEIYFVKFIINLEEDDVEQGVVMGRSLMRLTKGIANFENGTVIIYPELDPFLGSSEEEEKISDDWDLLLDDIDFRDIPDIKGIKVPPFMFKIGKNSMNKRKQLEKYQLIYSDMGLSLSTKKPLTQEEAEREILDGICLEKMKLAGEIKKEEEEAIIKIKGEALIEKEDHGAFVILIRLEGKINLNASADTGFDINVMPYRVYKELGREEVHNVKRGITMLNHSKADPMGLLKDVLCQTMGAHNDEAGSSRSKRSHQYEMVEEVMLPLYANDDLKTKKVMKFRLCGRACSWMLLEFAKRALDTTTLRELIESEGRLILKAPVSDVPRVAIPRPPRALM